MSAETRTRTRRMRLERTGGPVAWDDEYDDSVFYVLVTSAALTRRAAIEALATVAASDWDQMIDPAAIDEDGIRLGHFRDISPDSDEGVRCGPDHPDAMRYWRIPLAAAPASTGLES